MRIIFGLTFIFVFSIVTNIPAQTDTSPFKLLSWNTYMVSFPMVTNQKKRAKGMVEVLKVGEYDLICFQEVHHKGVRKIIWEELKEQYPYQIISGEGKFSFKPSSGLWVLSKKPIHKIKEIEFEAKNGMEKFLRKAAVLFEMDGLKDFHFIVTHMQSAIGEKETTVRKGQSMQIYTELVEPFLKLNKTLLFAGDWNMEPHSAFDNSSLRKLFHIAYPESLPTEITWPSTSFRKNVTSYLLDLIMLSYPNDRVANFKTGIPNLTYPWKKGKKDLSDHLPIEATFELKR